MPSYSNSIPIVLYGFKPYRLEELAEAFNSWYGSDDERDNPPGYRKFNYYDDQGRCVHGEHLPSMVTWK